MSKKSITTQIDELRKMSAGELRSRYQTLFGADTRIRNRTWLVRRCSWRIQEIELGGLGQGAKDRLEALIGEIKLPIGEGRTVRGSLKNQRHGRLNVGDWLARDYKGRQVRALVRDNGFEYEGLVYASLSAVARAVTGSKWNGKLFFGLSTRKKKEP